MVYIFREPVVKGFPSLYISLLQRERTVVISSALNFYLKKKSYSKRYFYIYIFEYMIVALGASVTSSPLPSHHNSPAIMAELLLESHTFKHFSTCT